MLHDKLVFISIETIKQPRWEGERVSVTQGPLGAWLVEAKFGDRSEMVGINTNHPNRLVAEAIEAKQIKELTGYGSLRREDHRPGRQGDDDREGTADVRADDGDELGDQPRDQRQW